ncbi:MAG: T9SS type A sorting domain-containing protein, partial [Bacteroidia bacterium]
SIVVTPTASAVYSVSVVSGTLSCSNSASITVNPSPTVSISGPTVACAGDVVTYTASGASTYTWNTSATTTTLAANTSSTTSYTVTGTSAGCSNVAVASLSVVPVPTVGLASTFTTCAGNPVSITATGATTYSWSTSASGSSIAPSPTASANYSVTGYNGTCSNTAVAMVTVTPLPTLSVSSTSSLICTGQTASLTANGATTYSWSTSGTTSVIAVSPTVTTAYTVTGTSAGCSNVSTITQSVSACTGVLSESNLKETVSVFPNPAKNAITIKLDGDASVNIFNSLGSLILKDELHEGNNTVDLQHQPNGIYFVIINRAGSSETIKIIKEN